MGDHDSQWYGTDPDGHIPPDDGLHTVEVNDVDFELPDEIMTRLANEINPLETSQAFGIDIFQRGVAFMQNTLPL